MAINQTVEMAHSKMKGKLKFEQVYESLFPILFRIAFRITGDRGLAEDLCHEAFVQYIKRKVSIIDLEQTKYWLIRVVRNLSLNYEKKLTRERKAVDRLQSDNQPFTQSVESDFVEAEARSAVQNALNALPYNQRMALVLKTYAGMQYREIGSILGISEGNVKVRIFRARARLAQLLREGELSVS